MWSTGISLKSYWPSEGLSSYSSQPACEKIHPNQHHERFAKIRKKTCNVAAKRQWLPNRRLSARTIRKHLKSTGMKSRRVTERLILSDRHQQLRLAWCLARIGLNLRIWRRAHWSDERRFLLHLMDEWEFGDRKI